MIKKLILASLVNVSLFAMGGPALVETTKLVKGEVNPLQQFVGTLEFDKKSVLAAQNSGVIKSMKFELGDTIKKGKMLVQIDADLLNAQIKAANASLANAKEELKNANKNYERYKKLLTSKSITQKEYDDSLLRLRNTKSTVKVLESKQKELVIHSIKKRIRAPFSGTIVEKNINIGEWVNAGTPIAKLVDTSVAKITFNVSMAVLDGLQKGDLYDIKVGNKVLKASLKSVIPNGDKLTRTFPVNFTADTKDIFVFEGQQAKVSLSKNGKKDALILPRDAVIKRFGQNVVFMITPKNTATMIPVQVVGYVSNRIAVTGNGLVPGLNIVVKGNERVFPNSPVKILNK